MTHEEIMRHAIRLSIENVERGGGPFAAVVAREGKILSSGVNTVSDDNDPTAHAEINAIRAGGQELQKFHLDNCVLYTTCEPCPMCLGAIYWAGIRTIIYGNTRDDAARYGFQDDHIYHEIGKPMDERMIKFSRILGNEAIEAFNSWDQKSDKILY